MASPLQPTTSAAEVVAHGTAFRNTEERPPGSGNFVLPLRKKLLYAWPGLGYTAMRFLRGTQLKKFYSDVVGVPVWWIAMTVSLAVSLDALSDPLIGFFSDSLRWEYKGEPMRRRPFIAIGSLFLSTIYMLLWAPCIFYAEECSNTSNGGAAGPTICEDQSHLVGNAPFFYLALYAMYYCSMGTVLIPLEALGAELTPGHADRTSLMATYFAACILGILLAILAPAFVDTTAPTGFLPLACIFCAVFVSGAFSVAAKLKEKPAEHDNPPLVPSMVNCLRNPLFRVLLLNQLVESIGAGTQYELQSK